MSTWYYYNDQGEKVQVTGGQLKGLAKAGQITPETLVETEDGKTVPARKIKGLTFIVPESKSSKSTSHIPAQSAEPETYGLASPPTKPSAVPPVSNELPVSYTNGEDSQPAYFYTDENGYKFGPIDMQRLQTLIERGTITPVTPLETGTGQKGLAGQIPGLKFDTMSPPVEPVQKPPKSTDAGTALRGVTGVASNLSKHVFQKGTTLFKQVAPKASVQEKTPPEPSNGPEIPPEFSTNSVRSFGSERHDVGFRVFLSPLLIVFIWWFTVVCCVIGYVGYIGNELRPYFSAMSEYRAEMSKYRTAMREYNSTKPERNRAMQEYERDMQKYHVDKQEYDKNNSMLTPPEQRRELTKPEEPKRPKELNLLFAIYEDIYGQNRPLDIGKLRELYEKQSWEPERPTRPSDAYLPVLPILIATVCAIYSLIIIRIFLEFIAVNFRMEKHQRVIRDKYENK